MDTIAKLRKLKEEGYEFVITNSRNDDGIGGFAKSKDEAISVMWSVIDTDQGGWPLYGSDYKVEAHWINQSPEIYNYQSMDSYIDSLERMHTLIDEEEASDAE
jgi:hypothetical protein